MLGTVISVIHILALLLLFGEALYVVMQKPSSIQVHLLIVSIGTIIMILGYVTEMNADTYDLAIAGVHFAYLGKPFALVGTTMFLASYCGYKIPRKVLIAFATYAAFITVVVFTDEHHHLYYSDVTFNPNAEFSGMSMGHGPLYYVYMFGIVVCLILNISFAVKAFRKSETLTERAHAVFMFILVISAIVGYIIYLTGVTNGYDTTILGCVIGAICLLILFTRLGFFNIIAIAKDQALDGAHNAFLVINKEKVLEYANSAMNELLKEDFIIEELIYLPEGLSTITKGVYTYSARKKLVQNEGKTIGWVIEIVDITDSYNYSQKLEKEVADRISELQHVQRKVIAGFTNIVEARDGSTGDHIKNTIKYVTLIAQNLRKEGFYRDILTDEYIQRLIDAAPLHDIGKLSIPDTVLLKPGRLTEEEFEVIKAHTTSGEIIIEKTMRGVESDDYIRMAKDVVLYHHEKWDGSGYPKGLRGDDIPLSARIMAVADVYDALISERCYKPAFSKEESCAIIRENSGTHFEPIIANIFLANIK